MDPVQETYYSGYRATGAGMSVWPGRQLKHRWGNLASITSWISPDGRGLGSSFVFTVGRSLTLRSIRGLSVADAMGRFAEVLAMACAAAPPAAVIDEFSREIARWGIRTVRQQVKREAGYFLSVDQWLVQARHHRVRLEFRKALAAVDQALHGQPDDRAALQFRVQLLAEQGAKQREIVAAAARWASFHPQDPAARVAHLIFRLRSGDESAAVDAEAWLAGRADEPVLSSELAGYHWRQGKHSAAAAVWTRLATASRDATIRSLAARNAAYAQNCATDRSFRWKEKLKVWGRSALPLGPLIVIVAAQAIMVFMGQRENQDRREDMERRAKEMRRALDRTEKNYLEATGRVMGNPATLRERAEAGEPAAELTLADYYFQGSNGVAKNPALGLQYLERAAGRNHRAAVLELAERLDAGNEVARDRERAMTLYAQAAELGSPRAARILGQYLQSGEIVAKDEARAFAYFQRAAADGHIHAMTLAGWALENGLGTDRDPARAIKYYVQAAEGKDRWAQEKLVEIYLHPVSEFHSETEAWKWTELGAKQGSERLKFFAVWRAQSAAEVTPAQEKQALAWMHELAEAGHGGAAYLLGQAYRTGWQEAPDLAKSAHWYLRAAELGSPEGLSRAVRLYAFGIGVERNPAKAASFLDRLEKSGAPDELVQRCTLLLEAATQPLPDPAPVPRQIWNSQPDYPIRERRNGIEGQAVIRFSLDDLGFTKDPIVIEASHPAFGLAATNAVRGWRYSPAWKNGKPVLGPLQIVISFKINDSQADGNPQSMAPAPGPE